LTPFKATDGNWPSFMRVHPVLEWGLREVWCFLRHPVMGDGGAGLAKGLDYCEMYDEGYTSLGGRGDTVRNPKLKVVDEEGRVRYRPAWMMVEDGEERAGRE
jgi:FAD synthetase